MTKQFISIQQDFNASLKEIFSQLTDHEQFGILLGANIKRVAKGKDGFLNGQGSVRRIKSFPVPAFEETVVMFKENERMEYSVSKGGPIKKHVGIMIFDGDDRQSSIRYDIEFEPKIPFTGGLIKSAIEKPLRKGLKKLAHRYQK